MINSHFPAGDGANLMPDNDDEQGTGGGTGEDDDFQLG